MLRYTRPREMNQQDLNKLEDKLVIKPDWDNNEPAYTKKEVQGLLEHIAYLEQKTVL